MEVLGAEQLGAPLDSFPLSSLSPACWEGTTIERLLEIKSTRVYSL